MYRSFKGTNSEYRMLHYWVEKQLGKPKECENCERTDEDYRYHWANISGEYIREIWDWARLCQPCHLVIDNIRLPIPKQSKADACHKGHSLLGDNLSIKRRLKNNIIYNTRICKACNRLHQATFRKHRLEEKLSKGV